MVRFKEFAGFVLLGTVIFILSFLGKQYVIPLMIILLGVGLGLWMIGKFYDVNSPLKKKMTIRMTALVLAGVICAFGWNLKNPIQLPWKDFTEKRLEDAIFKDGRTVLIDFTADW